jgi:uncharacterized damage-inducible protein DinB
MWEAETIWWKRLQLEENVPPPGAFEALPMDEVMARLPQQSAMTMKWVSTAREEKLAHVIAYRNSKRVEFKQPVFQILLQLFNHQTYHRGQLVCIFRQVAAVNIPNTDFINWSRKK